MGNEAHDFQSQNYKLKLLLLIVILINFVSIFIGPFSFYHYHPSRSPNNSNSPQLAASFSLISDLYQRLNSSNLLVQALLIELTRQQDKQYSNYNADHSNNIPAVVKVDDEDDDAARVNSSSDELNLALGPHKLPFGYSPRIGSDEIRMPVGAACFRFQEELNQYMAYEVGGECPVDDVLVERLMLKGCEPLPRRRCHPKTPANYADPTPLPESLWTTPPDTSIIWDPYTCKSYQCLIDRKNKPVSYNGCKTCFDLRGNDENSRWLYDNGRLEFGIDQVLTVKLAGTVRIGLDINGGGGTGTFAARMRERNVTIITSTLNQDAPFNSFIASRGLVPLHLSISQRLPFFENTLDIVHSMNVLGNWIPETMLEFVLYDIFRVLRPGGLFWLDHFFCFRSQMNKTYTLMLGQVGFKRLRWHAGMKLGSRHKNEWYISALLEKPKT